MDACKNAVTVDICRHVRAEHFSIMCTWIKFMMMQYLIGWRPPPTSSFMLSHIMEVHLRSICMHAHMPILFLTLPAARAITIMKERYAHAILCRVGHAYLKNPRIQPQMESWHGQAKA